MVKRRFWQTRNFYLALLILAVGLLDGILLFIYIQQSKKDTPKYVSALTLPFHSCEKEISGSNFLASPRYRCYQHIISEGVKLHGIAEASKAFDEYIMSKQGSTLLGGACHALGHDLGQAAVMRGYDGADILTYCSTTCEGGCFNGVGHTYLALGRDATRIDEFCNPREYSGSKERIRGCYHGFGHGITDTLGTNLKENLRLCDLIKDKDGRFECGHAVFMTFSTLPIGVEFDNIPSDFSDFCAHLDPLYQFSCFIFSGYLTYGKTEQSEKAFRTCMEAPSEYQQECFKRIGESIFIAYPSNSGRILEFCDRSDNDEHVGLCMTGAAKTAVVNTNSSPEFGFEICELISDSFQEYCYQSLGKQIEQVFKHEERVRMCKSHGKLFIKDCLGGVEGVREHKERLF